MHSARNRMLYKDKYDLRQVRVIEVKPPTPEFRAVTVVEEIYPTILVNERLCPKKKREAIQHEYFHILNGDIYRSDDEDVQQIEYNAHKRNSV